VTTDPVKLIVPFDRVRHVRLSPHRFGQAGNLIIVEDDQLRLDLHLSDAQMASLGRAIAKRLASKEEA
jgi:hypothetical protein